MRMPLLVLLLQSTLIFWYFSFSPEIMNLNNISNRIFYGLNGCHTFYKHIAGIPESLASYNIRNSEAIQIACLQFR